MDVILVSIIGFMCKGVSGVSCLLALKNEDNTFWLWLAVMGCVAMVSCYCAVALAGM